MGALKYIIIAWSAGSDLTISVKCESLASWIWK